MSTTVPIAIAMPDRATMLASTPASFMATKANSTASGNTLEISKALSKVEAAIVGDQTSEHVRRSKGFATTARRAKRSTDLLTRESELASGFGEFRYCGYVTVSASSPEELEQACAAMENRALQSRLQLRRMNGMQDIAFTHTLPIARGLSGPGGAR